jgi:hypothetical protein
MIFVRPDSGEKTFQAQLIDLQDFDNFWSVGSRMSAEDDDVVVVSTPKNIQAEFRVVCSKYNDGEIIAHSTYQYQKLRTLIPSVPVGVLDKCKEVFKCGYFPDSVFCIDIFQDGDLNFWVGELTSFSSAGLYACDKKKIAHQVSQIAEMEWMEKSFFSE